MSLVPFDPNGMAVDFLRSCYSCPIMYVSGDSTITEIATWYFCAPTAKPFPFECAFGSPTWDTVHPTVTTLGFDGTAKRKYYNGRRLNSSPGTTYAGPAEYFVSGAPAPGILPKSTNGTPIECLHPPFGLAAGGLSIPVFSAKGGKLAGGSTGEYIPPGEPCPDCPGITPATVTVSLSGFSGPASIFNGNFQLPQIDPCDWEFNIGGHNNVLVSRGVNPGEWLLQVFGDLGYGLWSGQSSDCTSPLSLSKIVSIIGGDDTQYLSVP